LWKSKGFHYNNKIYSQHLLKLSAGFFIAKRNLQKFANFGKFVSFSADYEDRENETG